MRALTFIISAAYLSQYASKQRTISAWCQLKREFTLNVRSVRTIVSTVARSTQSRMNPRKNEERVPAVASFMTTINVHRMLSSECKSLQH